MYYSLRQFARSVKNSTLIFYGFYYDALRYVLYSAIWNRKLKESLGYRLTKQYHRIEKSLSYPTRKPGAGWNAIDDTVRAIKDCHGSDGPIFEYDVARSVVRKFLDQNFDEARNGPRKDLFDTLKAIDSAVVLPKTGAVDTTRCGLQKGKLEHPEQFFGSRKSVRRFSEDVVADEEFERVLRLAESCPSVCNRQTWHIYRIKGEKNIKEALRLQNGNRGFTEEIANLVVVTSDLRAFDSYQERYQAWIDGGLYAMSVVYAMHSIGIASCFLNWSEGPKNDKRLRRLLHISPSHVVITMIAFGTPAESLKVCASPRNPIKDSLTIIE